MDQETKDLESVIEELVKNNEPASLTTEAQVKKMCLEAVAGWFVLYYDGNIPGTKSYDWIGLFASVTAPDNEHIGGNNWNWASKGRTYKTSTAVATSGYEARYMIWDGKKYRSIRRSGPLVSPCS